MASLKIFQIVTVYQLPNLQVGKMEPEGTRGNIVISDSSRRALSTQEETQALFVLEGIMTSLGKMQQYPITNEIVVEKVKSTFDHISKWLRTYRELECVSVQGNIQINKAVLSLASQEKDFIQSLIFFLSERNVRTLNIEKGVNLQELNKFLEFFNKPAKEFVTNKNIARTLKRIGLRHIIISSEMILEDVVIKTKMSDELTRKLNKLNVDDLLEKANIISQLEIGALNKVSNLATMVTNLRYTKNSEISDKILARLSQTLHDEDPKSRVASAMQFAQIAEKSVDYTMYDLHNEISDKMSSQVLVEDDPQVFGALAKGLEKTAQVHIAKGDYDKAMNIIQSIDAKSESDGQSGIKLARQSRMTINNIAKPNTIKKMITELQSKNRKTMDVAKTMLSRMGKNAVPELIDMIYSAEGIKEIATGIDILKEIGKEALSELYMELREEMAGNFRIAFISVIGEVGDVKSLKRLMPFLTDPDDNVVEETYRAFLHIGGPGAVQKIVDNLRDLNFENEFVNKLIMDINTTKNPEMAPYLVELLDGKGPFSKYDTPEIRIEAANALGKIGGNDAAIGLSNILLKKKGFLGIGKRDANLEVAVCNALRRIGDPGTNKGLKKATKSKHKKVKVAAELALKAILNKEESGRSKAIEAEKDKQVEQPETVVNHSDAQEYILVEDDVDEIEMAFEDTEMAFPDGAPSEDKTDISEMGTEMEFPKESDIEKEIPPTEFSKTVEDDELINDATTFGTDKGDIGSRDDTTIISEESPEPTEVRLVLTVGPIIVDGVRVEINGVDQDGKSTADQQGVTFKLLPGEYEAIIQDQGMKVGHPFSFSNDDTEIKIDLQDIFNF